MLRGLLVNMLLQMCIWKSEFDLTAMVLEENLSDEQFRTPLASVRTIWSLVSNLAQETCKHCEEVCMALPQRTQRLARTISTSN